MKRLISVLLIINYLFALTACVSNDAIEYEPPVNIISPVIETPFISDETHDTAEQEPEKHTETAFLIESSIPLEDAAEIFAKVQAIWDEDDGALWGVRLDAPLMIADSITRSAVANKPDPQGNFRKQGDVYVGMLPPYIHIGATAIAFGGLTWGVMPWEIITSEFNDEMYILEVLVHEAFHAVQDRVVSSPRWYDQRVPHMSNTDARISVMLELTSLMKAIRESGNARLSAIHDALSIRNYRRQKFPQAADDENGVEMHEGLAVFTDLKLLGRSLSESLDKIENIVKNAETTSTGLTSFGYMSGALYGLLLEETGADWKNGLTINSDLGGLLQQHLKITELTPFEKLDLETYGYTEIARTQTAWAENFALITEGAKEAIQRQPTLDILGEYFIDWETAEIENVFIPDLDRSMPDLLVLHGNFTVFGANWQVDFYGGYMRFYYSPDGIGLGSAVSIAINSDGNKAIGHKWELTITDDNYIIVSLPDGLIEIVER